MKERYKHRVTGKIIIKAVITNRSPLLIGKGSSDIADQEVLLLPDGRPYIPASSLGGCLRSWFFKWGPDKDNVDAEKFWGSTESNKPITFQSHIRFSDLIPVEKKGYQEKIVIRDGVKIKYDTGVAEEGAKYNYQSVEAGIQFGLTAEVTIREGMDVDVVRRIVGFINATLIHKDFRLGAFTNVGFGVVDCTGFDARYFDFSIQHHRDKWFEYLEDGHLSDGLSVGYEQIDSAHLKPTPFTITAGFRIKNSLLIGSYELTENGAEKSYLKSSNNKTSNGRSAVLSGKSIKGALRHRALKILKTMDVPESMAMEKLNKLMGWVDNTGSDKGQKSRLRIEEVFIEGLIEEDVSQKRIRIDRFTGGVISGALFSSTPVWPKVDADKITPGINVTLILTLEGNYEDWEATLLLLLLKDLWTEDLPIGGEKSIGRGVLTGEEATIKCSDDIVSFIRNGNKNGLCFNNGNISSLARFNKNIKELITNPA
jgi:CRISPR/Cas system CSM-associated protein Csm3 (group 7 of RAMP superfamily)